MALEPKKSPLFAPPIDMTDPKVREILANIDANLTFTVDIARLGFVVDADRKAEVMKTRTESHSYFRYIGKVPTGLKSLLVSLLPTAEGMYVLDIQVMNAQDQVALTWSSNVPLSKRDVLKSIQEYIQSIPA